MSEVTALEERIKKAQQKITVLEDIDEVRKVKYMYFYLSDNAIIAGDKAMYAKSVKELFLENSTAEWTGLGHHEGIDALAKFFTGFIDTANWSMHSGKNPIIKVNGDTATGTFYLHVALTMKKENKATWIAGRYDDNFKKVNGKWYIKDIRGHFYYWTPFDEGWVKKQYMF